LDSNLELRGPKAKSGYGAGEIDNMIRRTVLWAVLAAVAVAATYYLRIELSEQSIRLLIPPKIPLFGIIVAVGTFQYRIWRDLVAWADAQLYDPQWLAFEQAAERRRVAEGATRREDEDELRKREEHKEAVKTFMREGVLPHNRVILFNTLAVGGMLLVSSSVDVAWLMAQHDLRVLRAISTGTFVATLIPMLEAGCRYFVGLRFEFANAQTQYRSGKTG
jgi:hypothetical protein